MEGSAASTRAPYGATSLPYHHYTCQALIEQRIHLVTSLTQFRSFTRLSSRRGYAPVWIARSTRRDWLRDSV